MVFSSFAHEDVGPKLDQEEMRISCPKLGLSCKLCTWTEDIRAATEPTWDVGTEFDQKRTVSK